MKAGWWSIPTQYSARIDSPCVRAQERRHTSGVTRFTCPRVNDETILGRRQRTPVILDVRDDDGLRLPLGVIDRVGVCEAVMVPVTDRELEKLIEALIEPVAVTVWVVVALGDSAGFDDRGSPGEKCSACDMRTAGLRSAACAART